MAEEKTKSPEEAPEKEGVEPVAKKKPGRPKKKAVAKKKAPAKKKAAPKKKVPLERDELGLLTEVTYIFDENGFVDWRAMVPSKYIVLNERRLKKKMKNFDELSPEDKGELKKTTETENLLVLLAGFKEIARIRGYTISEVSHVDDCASDGVRVTHRMEWIPNFETNFAPVITSAVANANAGNCEGEFNCYLEPIAQNRAFVRCVRNFLNIHILGESESPFADLGASSDIASEDSAPQEAEVKGPVKALVKIMNEKGISFDKLIKELEKANFKRASEWKSMEDITLPDALLILDKLKK